MLICLKLKNSLFVNDEDIKEVLVIEKKKQIKRKKYIEYKVQKYITKC